MLKIIEVTALTVIMLSGANLAVAKSSGKPSTVIVPDKDVPTRGRSKAEEGAQGFIAGRNCKAVEAAVAKAALEVTKIEAKKSAAQQKVNEIEKERKAADDKLQRLRRTATECQGNQNS